MAVNSMPMWVCRFSPWLVPWLCVGIHPVSKQVKKGIRQVPAFGPWISLLQAQIVRKSPFSSATWLMFCVVVMPPRAHIYANLTKHYFLRKWRQSGSIGRGTCGVAPATCARQKNGTQHIRKKKNENFSASDRHFQFFDRRYMHVRCAPSCYYYCS